jgi:hypothetical protein
MTVREWLEIAKSTGGPGPMGGFGGLHPAFSSGATGAESSLGSPTTSPDLGSLPPDAELWIAARPTVNLDAPMARLGDEDVPWFEVESVRAGRSRRRDESLLDDYGEDASYVDDPEDYRFNDELDPSGGEDAEIGIGEPLSLGGLGNRIRHVGEQLMEPGMAGEHGMDVLSDIRLGITRNPRHHLLPQEELEFFQRNGFPGRDIDQYCVEVTRTEHEILHGGNQALARKYWQEREWSTALMKGLRAREVAAKELGGPDARLSRQDVLEAVEILRERFDIQDREIVPYRETHD